MNILVNMHINVRIQQSDSLLKKKKNSHSRSSEHSLLLEGVSLLVKTKAFIVNFIKIRDYYMF